MQGGHESQSYGTGGDGRRDAGRQRRAARSPTNGTTATAGHRAVDSRLDDARRRERRARARAKTRRERAQHVYVPPTSHTELTKRGDGQGEWSLERGAWSGGGEGAGARDALLPLAGASLSSPLLLPPAVLSNPSDPLSLCPFIRPLALSLRFPLLASLHPTSSSVSLVLLRVRCRREQLCRLV